jgi:uncharacterized protein
MSTEAPPTTEAPPAADGTVAVVGGKLVITDPGSGGSPAVVIAGEGVKFSIDGQQGGQSLSLTQNSRMVLDVGSTEPMTVVDVKVVDGAMAAELHIMRQAGVVYALEDQGTARELVLTRKVVENKPARPATEDDVKSALARAGVSHGIDEAEVQAALTSSEGGSKVVARGTPIVPPVDSEITISVQAGLDKSPLFSLRSGTLLARKTPPVDGTDGMTVLGAVLSAPPPKDPALEAGDGARAVDCEDGVTEVRATIDGRPFVKGAAVGVSERVILGGDVGVETGDVKVFGSLEITGSVEEGRSVWVSKDLTVAGEVQRATVQAGAGLTVGQAAVHSTLRAGGPLAVYSKALAAFDGGDEEFLAFAKLTRTLVETAAAKGQDAPPGKVAFTVLQSHSKALPPKIAKAREILFAHDKAEVGETLLGAFEAAFRVTDGLGAHGIPSLLMLDKIAEALTSHVEKMRSAIEQPASLKVGYIQGCEVEASGSLIITGGGTFNCEIFAGGDFISEGANSTVRGGTTRVGGRVRVNEIGAPGSAKVTIQLEGKTTDPDRLTANVIHEGAVVICNGTHIGFDARRVNLSVGVDDEKRVAHFSLKG